MFQLAVRSHRDSEQKNKTALFRREALCTSDECSYLALWLKLSLAMARAFKISITRETLSIKLSRQEIEVAIGRFMAESNASHVISGGAASHEYSLPPSAFSFR